MKKLFIIATLFALTITTKAQSYVMPLLSTTYPTLTIDTVTNTGSNSVYINVSAGYSNLTIQPIVTRVSGTMNSNSTPQLKGSIDGTNYYTIAGDTLHLTNTASAQLTSWILTQNQYKYYKIFWTGTGTMSATLQAKVFLVK